MGAIQKRTLDGFRRLRLIALSIAMASAVAVPSFAGGSDAFSLDWRRETVIGGAALGLYAWGHFATDHSPSSADSFGWFDDEWTRPYDSFLDEAGDIACLMPILALPLLPDRWNLESVSTIAVMYVESALLAVGVKNVLKGSFPRPRPYLSYDDTPIDMMEDEDRFYSFPSGHTTFAFMTASFATYVYSQGESSRASKWLMGGASFAVAGGTVVLRVASGMHYPTDVVFGAAIGTLSGLAVPWLHRSLPDGWRFSLGADKVSFTYSY
jgi:membrane-associated phospholipid phosphatase